MAASSLPFIGKSPQDFLHIAALGCLAPLVPAKQDGFHLLPESSRAVKCLWELINQLSTCTEPAVLRQKWKERVAHTGPVVHGFLMGSERGVLHECFVSIF